MANMTISQEITQYNFPDGSKIKKKKQKEMRICSADQNQSFIIWHYVTGYKCWKVEAIFSRSVTVSKMILLTLKTTWDPSDKPTCNVNWGDDMLEEIIFDKVSQVTADHVYTDFGIYTPTLSCEYNDTSSESCPNQNAGCSEDPAIFDNFFKKSKTPMKHFVHEKLTVNSLVCSVTQ